MKRDYNSDSFFQSTRTDQNSSTKFKFYGVKLLFAFSEIEPKKFFPGNIQYRARLKSPLFSFFGIVRLFFEKKLPKGAPFNLFGVLRQNGC